MGFFIYSWYVDRYRDIFGGFWGWECWELGNSSNMGEREFIIRDFR